MARCTTARRRTASYQYWIQTRRPRRRAVPAAADVAAGRAEVRDVVGGTTRRARAARGAAGAGPRGHRSGARRGRGSPPPRRRPRSCSAAPTTAVSGRARVARRRDPHRRGSPGPPSTAGVPVVDLLVEAGVAASKGEARRLLGPGWGDGGRRSRPTWRPRSARRISASAGTSWSAKASARFTSSSRNNLPAEVDASGQRPGSVALRLRAPVVRKYYWCPLAQRPAASACQIHAHIGSGLLDVCVP